MKSTLTILISIMIFQFSQAHAKGLTNPGFENGWQGWTTIDPHNRALEIVDKSQSGIGAALISSPDGYFAQSVEVQKNTNYEVSAFIRGAGILGVKVDKSLFVERTGKSRKWLETKLVFNTGDHQKVVIFGQIHDGRKVIFDDFSIAPTSASVAVSGPDIEIKDSGLSPDLAPGQNFDLLDWTLSVPEDKDGDGIGDKIIEAELGSGYTHDEYFYTGADGGMVMKAPVDSAPTKVGLPYTRVELREMLRRGNDSVRTKAVGGTTRNNWVLSTAPKFAQKQAGGVDGSLIATLAINHVTTTGNAKSVGKVVIGQIGAHKKSPLRLMYRKLPNHSKGSFYVLHEPLTSDEIQYYDVIGSRLDDAPEPQNGIALNEKFTFEIVASGHAATVVIRNMDNKKLGSTKIYLTKGGYDSKATHLYFRLGINNRDYSASKEDYVQATYYAFDNTHVGYAF